MKSIHKVNNAFKKLFGFNMPLDKIILLASNRVSIDIMELDELLPKYDLEYDPENCMYKGKECSMSEYIEQKYGKEALEFVEKNM